MEVLAWIFTAPHISSSKPTFSLNAILPRVISTKPSKTDFKNTLWRKWTVAHKRQEICVSSDGGFKNQYMHVWRLKDKVSSWNGLLLMGFEGLTNWSKVKKLSGDLCHDVLSCILMRLVGGVTLVMLSSVALNSSPSWALSEENLLFLEAWRIIDRAYVDKSFNGQNWFSYRENALRNDPMNTREETYMAIRRMLSSLDDTFTRFLEPEKFKSLRSGTQNSLTGVGLTVGFPTKYEVSSAGLLVISAAPGGPANRAGVLPGDVILAIDDTSTESMNIYGASEKLQGAEGSSVELTIRSGPEIKHLSLIREKVSLNPVKSRICEVPGSGKDYFKIGYIKLTTFNRNASGVVKEAIDTLRSNNVNAFVLDLRDNSGGLFPEGIKIARLW